MAWIAGVLALTSFLAALVSMGVLYRERRRWEAVDARLTTTSVVSYQRWGRTWYRVQAEYTYLARGQRYFVPYSFPRVSTDRESIDADRRRLDGQRVHRVFYHPDDPNDMLLDLGAGRFLALPLALALVAVCLGAALLITYLRDNQELCGVCGAGARRVHRFCRRCGVPLPARKGRLDPESGLLQWWLEWTAPKPHTKPVRDWGRRVAWVWFAASAVFLSYAARQAVSRCWFLAAWKSGTAVVTSSRVVFTHDGEARLVFQVEASLRRGSYAGTVKSDFFSRDYAWIRRQQRSYTPGSTVRVWFDPNDETQVRFGAGPPALLSDGLPGALLCGVGSAASGALCWFLWRPPVFCSRCRFRISRHDAFCGFCGKSERT